MGSMSVLGAIVILTGWFALVEYDEYSESERKKILERIKSSPTAIIGLALMPVGILINVLGTFIGSIWMVIIGATFIFVQSIIVSLLFWRRKRWKSILLLITMIILGVFLYIPLFF
ncbi:glucan phosphoethanolaminetransferase (alkaline phosphatase superfamily) [Virgibacillus natechei]|uniref:Glucan phosphoethanolaminetransferase (Alkaline phosphatase superfamily) n=1 Tax=Virgibacillus natechei TaxID=1216297 RepID=A0ABS4IK58_9BACI|nr:hypothetical protein [Virgibacillus natechei]MBP1970826.1 glucan phosphoethanolaminetransferase (alkaline phosphatase superfamily) [Virgibacillus natechei]UZD12282.1 hypothetical protein OLD84_15335 [Virgibacillus natechei]